MRAGWVISKRNGEVSSPKIGSFQTIWKDQKSITGHQVEAIVNYFRRVVYFKMGNLIQKHKDGRPPTFEKEKVTKNLLNRDAFDKYIRSSRKLRLNREIIHGLMLSVHLMFRYRRGWKQ